MYEPVNIDIEKFIFHVVHHGEDQPILMEHTPIDGFENFFKLRIKEILKGNRFNFLDGSSYLDSIRGIDEHPESFVEMSQHLAQTFHSHQSGNIKPGVMILLKADVDGDTKYILIKYDHEGVITYRTENRRAILEEISNTFSKSKSALQKSAVVDLNESVTTAIVTDKSDTANITNFFKGFLGIKRFYDRSTLTQKLNGCFLDTLKEHRAGLPPEFTSQASVIFYDHVQRAQSFRDGETIRELFGPHYTDEIGRTFNRKLKSADILGEEFDFDKRLRRPKRKKFRTQEGVVIQYDTIAEGTVNIRSEGDETTITITTRKLIEESW